ncbi:sterile alpha motif domain-containing protein 3-like [Clarias gariepinus]|uniref:sterile alpha motif domain-containing protein 3-like n=1 Tax=Clarias gariepinus TaxID=13013 RepID=UPI00234CF0B4|nr:sterile alpha motif domain-containing protein 3-like [Clarias gariepinus]
MNQTKKMTDPAKLKIVLGDGDSMKLTLPSGIPKSVEELESEIKKQCGVSGHFRLQYLDADFDDFLILTSTVDLHDKGTVKVVAQCAASAHDICSVSSADTDILSSTSSQTPSMSVSPTPSNDSSAAGSETMSSSAKLRSETWPINFPIPAFPYEVELELQKANEEFLNAGTSLNIDSKPKLKSEILKSLAAEIVKYKVYPRCEEYEEVAKALIKKHPSLQERGSVGGFYGWKVSLQWKMGNYRRTLRAAGCPEVKINSLKHKHGENTNTKKVKKPRKAEVNFYPDYPAGENKRSLEEERLALLSEVQKNDNYQIIKQKMEKTFAYRRHEVIEDVPFIVDFQSRWPALFCEYEIAAEFTRINTIPLIQTFMSKLDCYTSKLTSIYRRKGGVAGRKISKLMAAIDQVCDLYL